MAYGQNAPRCDPLRVVSKMVWPPFLNETNIFQISFQQCKCIYVLLLRAKFYDTFYANDDDDIHQNNVKISNV